VTSLTATSVIPEARVLVVDDEMHVRSALARSLTLLGYSADEAASGHQALAMLERTPYDASNEEHPVFRTKSAPYRAVSWPGWPSMPCLMRILGSTTQSNFESS